MSIFLHFYTDVLSGIDIFGLEDNLPDELVSSNSWGEQLGGNKPPAQGPGPGSQINGEDPGVPNVALQRQLQQQQLQHHLMQQASVSFPIFYINIDKGVDYDINF